MVVIRPQVEIEVSPKSMQRERKVSRSSTTYHFPNSLTNKNADIRKKCGSSRKSRCLEKRAALPLSTGGFDGRCMGVVWRSMALMGVVGRCGVVMIQRSSSATSATSATSVTTAISATSVSNTLRAASTFYCFNGIQGTCMPAGHGK